jgi:hypothetical protein
MIVLNTVDHLLNRGVAVLLLISMAKELYARGDRIRVMLAGRAPVPSSRRRDPGSGSSRPKGVRLLLRDGPAKAAIGQRR